MRTKSPADIAAMRKAGRVVAEMHERIRAAIRPGVTTGELDAIGQQVIAERGASSNFLGYHGFPAVICTSPNSVVVHGIPGEYRLQEGDIISIDCGAVVDGWHGDAAFTAPVGSVSAGALRLIEVTKAALCAAVEVMIPGKRMGDIGAAVQRTVETAGFSVVRDYTGHGIGRAMHELPNVPNIGRPGRGPELRVGDVFAIEPMVNAGSPEVVELDDGWTVVTEDGSLSAHFEHTVAITDDGPEILTC
ncbi:MAG: type I methionyl aminopeptidase [Acidimicrobiales bacterium]|nr:type I methionyl aminopeptidase [Acidimicrobiales bacterium]